MDYRPNIPSQYKSWDILRNGKVIETIPTYYMYTEEEVKKIAVTSYGYSESITVVPATR